MAVGGMSKRWIELGHIERHPKWLCASVKTHRIDGH